MQNYQNRVDSVAISLRVPMSIRLCPHLEPAKHREQLDEHKQCSVSKPINSNIPVTLSL